MKPRLASLSLAALALVGLFPVAPARADAAPYTVDAVHSSVIFRLKHMNTSWAFGRFNGISGKVGYDAAAPEKSTIEIKVDVNTVDTADAKRDGHLKSPDFFNAAKFPEITFTTTSAKKASDTELEVTGNLTLHGVTKSITIKVEKVGEGKGRDGESMIGFFTRFEIKRSDYGMNYGKGGIGDEVGMIVSLEASRK